MSVKKKSKFGKIVLWVFISGMVLLLLGAGAMAIFFPKEKFKQMAIEKISSTLDREVTIEGISTSFFGGIGAYLKNITIANPDNFEEEYMLTAEAFDIKFQFWPLLKSEVVVDKLILVEPVISLRKLSDGSVNYQFGGIDSVIPPEMADKVEGMTDESKLAVSAVSFDNLAIKQGRCLYVDDSSKINILANNINLRTSVKTEKAGLFIADGNITIDSLLFKMDTTTYPLLSADIQYDAEYDYEKQSLKLNESELTLNDIVFNIDGSIGNVFEMADAEFKIQSKETSFDKINSLLTDEQKTMMADYDIKSNWQCKASLSYNVDNNDSAIYSGSLSLSDMSLNSKEFPGDITAPQMDCKFDNNSVSLIIPKGVYSGNAFSSEANMTNFDSPLIKGNLNGALGLATLKNFMPDPDLVELAGDMNYNFDYEYQIEFPEKTVLAGEIDIVNCSYKADALPENIESLNSKMKLDSRNIIIEQFDLNLESSDMSLTGTVKNAFPYFIPGYNEPTSKPFLDFKLTSEKLDVDKLFPEAVPGEGASMKDVPIDSIPPIIIPDINGLGSGNIKSLIYSQVEFTDIKSEIVIEDRRIKVNNATANVYTGRVNGETEIDLNDFDNPVYSGNFQATQIEANDFLERFTKFGGHLYGKADLGGAFSARGLEPELIMQSLNMDGTTMFKEGRLVNFDIVKNVADQFNFSAPEEEKIRDMVNSFKVKDGRIKFDAMQFASNMGDWNIDGSAGFDGSLDYKCKVLLTEEYAKQIVKKLGSNLLGSLLKGEDTGRIEVPFKLKGTYSKPTIVIEPEFWQNLQKKFMEKKSDELEDKLGGALKKLFGN